VKSEMKFLNRKESSKQPIGKLDIPTYSSCIIYLLKKFGIKQSDIAHYIHKHPSFISHVKKNRLSLTVDDLELIEHETNLPIFWIFLEAADEVKIPVRLKKVYDAGKKFFNLATLEKFIEKDVLKK
jgi:transcriptional regulator with XRE-family HTH domain